MMGTEASAPAQTPPCKCCGRATVYQGALDFNRTAMDVRLGRRVFPVSAEMALYYRCPHCGFIFTDFCDRWSADAFRARIYNDDYWKADHDPAMADGVTASVSYAKGQNLAALFAGAQPRIRVLDFGAGGNPGRAGQALIDAGFAVTSYEPYFPGGSTAVDGTYDVIYAIEVLEHCHDLAAVTRFLSTHLAEHGLLYIETSLHPHPAPADVLSSSYIAPRNGHISIFTQTALTLLFRAVGINIALSSIAGIVGFKTLPDFPNRIFV